MAGVESGVAAGQQVEAMSQVQGQIIGVPDVQAVTGLPGEIPPTLVTLPSARVVAAATGGSEVHAVVAPTDLESIDPDRTLDETTRTRLLSMQTHLSDVAGRELTVGDLVLLGKRVYLAATEAEHSGPMDRAALLRGVAALSPQTGETLWYVHREGRSVEDTADRMGIMPIQVDRRLESGMTAIADKMETRPRPPAAIRQAEVANLVRQNGVVNVEGLAQKYGVFKETVRRDIDAAIGNIAVAVAENLDGAQPAPTEGSAKERIAVAIANMSPEQKDAEGRRLFNIEEENRAARGAHRRTITGLSGQRDGGAFGWTRRAQINAQIGQERAEIERLRQLPSQRALAMVLEHLL